jgi:hypothetical protein
MQGETGEIPVRARRREAYVFAQNCASAISFEVYISTQSATALRKVIGEP